MTLELLGITVLWIFLFGYIIVASIDFGAGFFNAYSTYRGTQQILTAVIQRYLSPVWEVTNVFLVFFSLELLVFFQVPPIIMEPLYWSLSALLLFF